MNNNGVNETNNQTIPGVKVAMPDAKPVDASTADAGAALSNAVRINEQPVATAAVQPVLQTAAPSVTPVSEPVLQQIATPAATATATVVVSSVPVAAVQPIVTATPAVVVAPTEVSAPVSEAVASGGEAGNKKKEKKPKNKLAGLLFLIIILLIGACAGLWFFHQQQMNIMRAKCTPVSTSGETKELDLDSTIVKDLYGKISTTIREDVGSVELNDELKLYLAFRQIANSDLYDSNCNKFSSTSMEPFTCEKTATFVPKAFKEDILMVEVKKLFGEDVNIEHQNVQLGNTCIGGYQYIKERGEYVQGQCGSTGATLYRVEKELISATSTESTIVLTEKVKYYGTEALDLPNRLVSGTYKHTFRLDMNYNYIYVGKELAS
jgi:hypothetical protein